MKLRFLLPLLACFFLMGSLSAQNRAERAKQRAENRANQKVNNKVDRSVDKAVDEAFDAIGGLFKKKRKPAEKTEAADLPAGSAEVADQERLESEDWQPYTNERNLSFSVEVTTTKNRNGKEQSILMDYAVIEDAFGMSFKDQEGGTAMRMIMDTQTGKTTTITTDKKGRTSGMRMKMPNLSGLVGKTIEETTEYDVSINRTGERKTIDGYNCEKMIVTNNETGDVTTGWITNDIDLTWQEMYKAMTGFSGNAQANMPNFTNLAAEVDGIMIQGTMLTDKETISMHYKNIKLDENADQQLFNLDGIEVMDIGF